MKYARSLLRFQTLLITLAAILVAAVTARSAPLTDTEKAIIAVILGNKSSFYSVGGTVTYLASGKTLTLQLNGSNNLSISSNGSFLFSEDVMGGDNYQVTVLTQPSGQTCTVLNGTGTAEDDIKNISVTCDSGGNYASVIRGRTIDGYIQGATVFLDINGNGTLDGNEPSGSSGEGGRFEIGLNEEQAACKALAPVVADVPVGAIDETLGEVTEAFQMALPPGTEEINSDQEIFITPLTSVLWAELYSLYSKGELPGLSCSELSDNPAAQEALQSKIDQVILQTVQAYNIPADELLSDYVASGSSESQRAAEDIVAGLQLSLKEQLLLEQANPDANSVRVVVERSLGSKYNDPLLASDAYGWYRRWAVQKDGLLTEGIVRLSEDLSSESYLLFYKEWFPTQTNNSGVKVGFRREIALRSSDQVGAYTCVGFEDAVVSLDYEQSKGLFEIATENGTSMGVTGWEECDESVHSQTSYSQNIFITERPRNRSDGVLLEQGYYAFDSSTGIPIPATKGLSLDLERINADDILSKIPIFNWRFYDGPDLTAAFTSKHFEYQSTNKILIEKFTDPESQWRRVEHLPDNTVNEQWAYAPFETNLECIDWQQSYSPEGAFNIIGDCTSTTFVVATSVGSGGEVIPVSDQEVAAGTPARFLICPYDGYQVASASDNCDAGGGLHGLTYVTGDLSKDCSVTVSFIQTGAQETITCAAENTTPTTAP